MVLDAKAMDWASEQGFDTAKLRAAKVPIYGKWYFPDLPAGVPMISLKTGEIVTFGPDMRAGEVLFVSRAALRQARLGPYAELEEAAPAPPPPAPAAAPARPRPAPAPAPVVAPRDEAPPGVHMPSPSIYPLILAVGIAIGLLGLATGPVEVRLIIAALGIIYVLAGGFGWAIENQRDGADSELAGHHEAPVAD